MVIILKNDITLQLNQTKEQLFVKYLSFKTKMCELNEDMNVTTQLFHYLYFD